MFSTFFRSLIIFFALVLMVPSVYADTPSCSAVFPDGAQTHSSRGYVRFDWGASINGSPDNSLDTASIRENSGGVSCDTGNCAASGNPVDKLADINIPNSRNDVTVSSGVTQTLQPGNYDDIRFRSNSKITLEAGDYYVAGSFTADSSVTISIAGSGIARLFINGRLTLESNAKMNVSGSALQLFVYTRRDVQLKSSSTMTALVYAKDNIQLYDRATLNGAATGAYVLLGSSASEINYDASDVAGAEFGDVCGGGGLTAPPATDDGPAAGSCEAIFADGVQSHSSSGQVIFNWQSKVLNSPDKIIATPKISDSSGGTSCGDQACSATFSPSEKIDFNAYSTGGSRISMSYNSDLSITPGTYSSVSVAGKGTLTLASGDYYISGNFTMDWQSNLEITGSDPVRIFVNGFFAGGGQTDINKGGDADKLFVLAKRGLTFNTQDEAVGFFYSEGTVSLGHLSEVTGAVSGERVTLGSTGATIIYDQAALGNASFGDICAATGNTINPPKLEYRFDDCSIENQLSDSSANGYHGTPYLADAEDGVVGQAIDLSSSGRGYIQLPEAAFDNLGDFTVSAWINLDSEGSWLSPNVLVSAGPGLFVLSELHISLYSRQVSVRTSGASASISHTHNLVGSWNHLTVSRTGNQVCVYINGALVGCDTTNDRPLDVSTNDDALIGRFNVAYFFSFGVFDGLLDEFKVFDYALSAAETKAMNDAELAGNNYDQTRRPLPSCLVTIPDPVLDLPMDAIGWNGVQNEVRDLSANANHGLAEGDATTVELGQVCRAGAFDGNGDSVQIPNLSDHLNGTATLSFWIKTNQSGATNTWQSPAVAGIEQHGGTDDIFWGFIHRDGTIGVAVGNDASTRSTRSINNGEWHHVVLSRDASSHAYQVFINGQLEKSGTLNSKTISLAYDNIGHLANSRGGNEVDLKAQLDELTVFDQVLTPAQVQLIYQRQTNDQRWDGSTPVCAVEPNVDHYGISATTPALTCEYSTVTVTAYDSQNQAIAPDASTQITLSAAGADGWALASGGGSSSGSNFTYTFTGAETSASFKLYHSDAVNGLDIDVTDGTATDPDDGQAKDTPVNFVNAALRFYADGIADSIGTHLSGKANNEGLTNTQTLTLKAVGTDAQTGACTALQPGTVNVGFAYECVDPNSCALASSGALISGNTVNQGTLSTKSGFASQSLTFDANGEAGFTLNYLDAGLIKLHAALESPVEVGSGTATLEGSSNNFVVKPAGLCVAASAAESACVAGDASCNVFTAAGAPFDINVSGKRWSQSAQTSGDYCSNATTANFALSNIALTHNLVAPTGGQLGSLGVNSVDITAGGTATESNQTIDEVGVFTITATAPSYFGESISAATSANIGRFIPANFQLSAPQNDVADACNNTNAFTYMGQGFTASGRLQAMNSAGGLTSNYTGDFAKLSDSLGSLSYGALSGSTNLSNRLSGVGGAFSASTVFSWAAGEGDFTTSLQFSRLNSPDGLYTAALGVGAQDADGVQLIGLDLDVDNDGTDDFVNLGNSSQRYGRLAISNSYGPETTVLTQLIRTEYFDGERFVANADDGDSSSALDCTMITASDVRLRVIDDDSSPDDSAVMSAGAMTGIVLDSGNTDARFSSALLDQGATSIVFGDGANGVFGAGNTGQVEVTIDVPSYLEYDWDGADSDDEDPSGTVTFGNYRGNDNIIFWLER